jgi:hypothetical protein
VHHFVDAHRRQLRRGRDAAPHHGVQLVEGGLGVAALELGADVEQVVELRAADLKFAHHEVQIGEGAGRIQLFELTRRFDDGGLVLPNGLRSRADSRQVAPVGADGLKEVGGRRVGLLCVAAQAGRAHGQVVLLDYGQAVRGAGSRLQPVEGAPELVDVGPDHAHAVGIGSAEAGLGRGAAREQQGREYQPGTAHRVGRLPGRKEVADYEPRQLRPNQALAAGCCRFRVFGGK